MTVIKWLILGVIGLCASCGQTQKQSSAQVLECWKKHDVNALEGYKVSNAAADAKRALELGDTRLRAIRGFTLTTPPLDLPISQVKSEYGIVVIEGTADTYCDKHHQELNAIARNYATVYNKTILAKMKSKK